jgi:hypothetical protein
MIIVNFSPFFAFLEFNYMLFQKLQEDKRGKGKNYVLSDSIWFNNMENPLLKLCKDINVALN